MSEKKENSQDNQANENISSSQVTSTTHTVPASQFPYKYNKIHPQLYIPKQPNWFTTFVLSPLNILTMPIFGLVRLLFIAILLALNSITVGLIDIGTDRSLPQTPRRKKMVMFTNKWYCSQALFFGGFIIKHINKSNPQDFKLRRAMVQVSNHRTILDSLAVGAVGTESILGSKMMTSNFFTKYEMKACRGLQTGSHCIKQLTDRYKSDLDWPALLMFPEGCVTPTGVILRPKLGAFLPQAPVQPVALHYNSKYAVEWLAQPIGEMVLSILLTFFQSCTVTYLPIQEKKANETVQQFADRTMKMIADELNENFVPYTKNDVYYFLGKKGFGEELCSKEYLEDFGWMGNQKHYKAMCKQAGLNWRIQHDREEFSVREELKMSEHAPLISAEEEMLQKDNE